jgi:hypothetical protein
MEEQQDPVPDKAAYQANRRKMCWAALAMMIATTVVTLLDPERVKAAESILMTQYLALSGLVATYFGFGGKK